MINRRLLMVWAFGLCLFTPVTWAADTTSSQSQAQRFGRLAAKEQLAIEQRGALLHNDALTTYLQTISHRLWQFADSDLIPPTVLVIRDKGIDAFTYPNGVCYLTTGMLELVENEDQLAMVLAHEMVHYIRQHTIALYRHLHLATPEIANGQITPDQPVAQSIDAAENQADREGLALAADAGYCGSAAMTLLDNVIGRTRSQSPPTSLARLTQRKAKIEELLQRRNGLSPCIPIDDHGYGRYRDKTSQALLANARAALQTGDWEPADASISRYMKLRPLDANAYFLKGELLRRRGDNETGSQSIAYFEKAIEIDPNLPSAHLALGELHFKAGRYRAAKPYFETFLSLAPRDKTFSYIKGYLRLCQN